MLDLYEIEDRVNYLSFNVSMVEAVDFINENFKDYTLNQYFSELGIIKKVDYENKLRSRLDYTQELETQGGTATLKAMERTEAPYLKKDVDGYYVGIDVIDLLKSVDYLK